MIRAMQTELNRACHAPRDADSPKEAPTKRREEKKKEKKKRREAHQRPRTISGDLTETNIAWSTACCERRWHRGAGRGGWLGR